jgi:hypothetical protein
MTVLEKTKNSINSTVFTLYKEGLFYKCFNEDAMIFSQRVKGYKVTAKFVKSVGAEVLSLGFPISEVVKGNLTLLSISESIGATNYKDEPHGIVFSLKEEIKQNYNEFQAVIIRAKESDAENDFSNNNASTKKIEKMILEFDLANSTPMQGLVFIQELKKNV